jgi:outer membrane protein OmpA-like peptidoglycan-associated protein
MKLISLSACLAMTLFSGCVLTPKNSLVPSIGFNYKTENGVDNNIVQVFEMNGNTVIQIKDIDYKKQIFTDGEKSKIEYEIIGQSAILSGFQREIYVISSKGTSKITRIHGEDNVIKKNNDLVMDVSGIDKVPKQYSSILENASEQDIINELDRIKKELATLKSYLAEINLTKKNISNKVIEKSLPILTNPTRSPIYRISFKNNSNEFDPDAGLRKKLIELSLNAKKIIVTGYTDGLRINYATRNLAEGRALSAKKYFIFHGVSEEKISVLSNPSGGFIAENITEDGKYRNRRVEIEII